MDVETRLARLERENRIVKAQGLAGALLAAATVAVGAQVAGRACSIFTRPSQ